MFNKAAEPLNAKAKALLYTIDGEKFADVQLSVSVGSYSEFGNVGEIYCDKPLRVHLF